MIQLSLIANEVNIYDLCKRKGRTYIKALVIYLNKDSMYKNHLFPIFLFFHLIN